MNRIFIYIGLLIFLGSCMNKNKNASKSPPDLKKYTTESKNNDTTSTSEKTEADENYDITEEDLKNIARQKIQQALDLKILWKKENVNRKNIEKLAKKIFVKTRTSDWKTHLQQIKVNGYDSLKVDKIFQLSFEEINPNEMIGKYQAEITAYDKKIKRKLLRNYQLFFQKEQLYLEDKVLTNVKGKILKP